jgi:hypothetical protein
MIHDIEDCLRSSEEKQQKRLKRLHVLFTLNGYSQDYIDTRIKQLNLQTQRNTCDEYSVAFLQTFCEKGMRFNNHIVRIDNVDPFANIKKYICNLLTNKINNPSVYHQTTCVSQHIWYNLQMDRLLAPYCEKKQILFVQKGSMAQRCVLLQNFPNNKSLIDSAFGCGGDNDCIVLIDPTLKNFNKIHTIIKKKILKLMMKLDLKLELADTGYIDELDTNFIASDHPHIITQRCNKNLGYAKYISNSNSIYVSYNDCLEFFDDQCRKAHFTLLRYKYGMKVYNKIFGGELLDIAIPYSDDVKSANTFYMYKTQQWTTFITLVAE